MKKTILLTSIAALTALSSCTMDEIKEVNQGTPIGFRTSVATRGTEATEYTLNDFYCTAWLATEETNPYFSDLYFGNQDKNFISNPTYYWPKGKNLYFYAYAPKVEEMGEGAEVNITKTVQTITGYQVPTNIDEQDDLIFATNKGEEEEGVPESPSVELNFAHMLSRININAKTNSELYEYKFAGARIGGVKMKGDVDLATAAWNPHDDSKGVCQRTDKDNPITMEPGLYSFENDLLGELPNIYTFGRTNYAFMIPQSFTAWDPVNNPTNSGNEVGAYISVYVQINNAEGTQVYPAEKGEYGWVAVPIPEGEWLAGYSYSYTLDFTNGAGYFDPDDVPDGSTVGGSVLGESIKVTMTMNEMGDADLGVLVNQDMIGVWKAHYFRVDTYYYTDNDKTNPYEIETDIVDMKTLDFKEITKTYEYDAEKQENKLTETTTTVTEEYQTDDACFNAINGRAGGFGYVEIHNGTKLKTLIGISPYTVDRTDYNGDGKDDIVMYIENYEDQENPGKYVNIPVIEEIIPVSANGNGSGIVKSYFNYTKSTEIVTIYYTIEPIPSEESTESTEPIE